MTSWFATTDHKRIAVLYLLGIGAAAVAGGVLALLLGIEATTSGPTLVDRMTHARLLSTHGMVMVFAVAIPAIPAVIGNFVLPLQLGAGNLALPRLNLVGFYAWLTGAALLLFGFAAGGSDAGWELAAPYSIESPTRVSTALVGLGLLATSVLLGAINTLVTIHLRVGPSHQPNPNAGKAVVAGWLDLPVACSTLAIAAAIELITAPVLLAGLILLGGDRTLGLGLFDPTLGGDPIDFARMFWFYAHPALLAGAIAAIGSVAEILSPSRPAGSPADRSLIWSCLALAALGLLSWGAGDRVDGQSELATLLFSAAALAIAVPATAVIGTLLGALRGGVGPLTTPRTYALGFVLLFALTMVTGLVLATLGAGDHLGGSLFSVAHLHYLAIGTIGVGFLAGLHYWWPKIFGRACPDGSARWIALGVVFATNLMLVPQMLLGTRGILRRAFEYPASAELLQLCTTIGAVALGLTLVAAGFLLARSVFRGNPAPADPWNAGTLAWTTPSPPPPGNFATPIATQPSPPQVARLAGGWSLVAGVALFGGLLAVAWGVRSGHPGVFAYGLRYLDSSRVTIATLLLVGAAGTVSWAVRAAALARRRALTTALLLALVSALGFVASTAVDYAQRRRAGTLWGTRFDPCRAPSGEPLPCRRELTAPQGESAASIDARQAAMLRTLPPDRLPPANAGLYFAVYFATTGLLLLPLLVGLVGLGRALARSRRAVTAGDLPAVTAIARCLHGVTLVWLALIALLFLAG